MNLFDLSGKVSVDFTAADRGVTENQKKVVALEKEYEKLDKTTTKLASSTKTHADHTTNLGHAFKALTAQVVVADGPLGGLASRMRAMSTEAGELSATLGPAGPIVAGLIATAGAALLLGDALFKLAEKTAKYGDDVFKAHEKTALTVETLSALKVAGEAVGVELSTMTTGLIRFTNNLELAASGNKKMIDVWKQLGVTAFQDNDKALSQFIEHFATLRTDQERTVAAGQAFGVRFGASLVEVFNRVGGNIEEFKSKLHDMGLLMTGEEAEAAHQFSVDLEMLEMRITGVGRTVGRELIPAFEAGFNAMEAALAANKTSWKEWGETLADAVLTAESLLGGLANIAKNFDWTNLIPLYGPLKADKDFLKGLTDTADTVTAAYNEITHPKFTPPTMDDIGSFGQRRFHLPPEHGSQGSDPAIEAKRLSEIQLQVVLEGFKSQEDALKRSLSTRTVGLESFTRNAIALAEAQHKATMEGLVAEEAEANNLRKPAIALAQINLKRLQEDRTYAGQTAKLFSDLTETILSDARAREEGLINIQQISAASRIDLWQRLADQRVITEETAVKAIGQIELQGLKLQMAAASNELARSGEDKSKQLAAQIKIAELQVRIAVLGVSTERAATDALQKRLRVQLEFNNALGQTWRNLHLQRLELDKEIITHDLEVSGGSKRKANRAIRGIDTEAENVQYRSAQAALRLQLIRDQEKASLDERNKLYEAFLAQRDLLEAQHAQNLKEIRDRPLVEMRQKMAALASDLTNVLADSIHAGFERGMRAGLIAFAEGILRMIESAALNALEKKLFDILSGAGSKGGGGWFSQLLNAGVGIASGAAGGGGGATWGNIGSTIGFPGMATASAPSASVKGGQSIVVNYHAAPGDSPASRATVYQMARQIQAMQGKVALTS